MAHGEKFTVEQRRQIVAWFALGDNATIVAERADDEFGIRADKATLFANYSYRSKQAPQKWKKFAARVRRMAERRLAEIPIARKEIRLQRLEFAAKEAMSWRTKSVSEWGEVQERKVGALVSICDAARKEIEGDKPFHLNVDQSTHYHHTRIRIDAPKEELAGDIIAHLSRRSPQPANGA